MSYMMQDRSSGGLGHTAILLVAILGLAALIYWVGLPGPFLLDDHQNLGKLALKGPGIHSFSDWIQFVFGGEAGPLGRPLSLASFTLNAQTWPADPWPFKLTNLLIHLANGTLVFFLARRIYRLAGTGNAQWCAALCAAFWTLHPIQVSTVLYVVQRMSELTAFFTLAGVYAYVHGRTLAALSPKRAYAWMVAGIVGGGTLAVLSKENGALLPLFALTLECTVLRSLPAPPRWRHAQAILLRVPVLTLITYLTWQAPQWLEGYHLRTFSPLERLGTQGQILLDYLRNIFIPRLSGSGLFFDNYAIVDDALVVISTWAAIVGLIVCALLLRVRYAVAAAAVLWFFAGHVLESTILNLELYFEHRNYLPMFGPALLVGLLIARAARLHALAAATIVATLALLTHAQARVWGDELRAAAVWPRENPHSARAHQIAIIAWQKRKRFDIALALMHAYADRYPTDPTTRVMLMEVSCVFPESIERYAEETVAVLRTGHYTYGTPDALQHLIELREIGGCVGLTHATLIRMIQALRDNPTVQAFPDQLAYVTYIEAAAYAAEGRFREAISTADTVAPSTTVVNFAYWQTIWALEIGDIASARRYLDRAHRFEERRRIGPYTPDPLLARLDELTRTNPSPGDG